MPKEINSFFTRAGIPATDIGGGYPSLRIWSINGSTYTLVVGAPSGTGLNTDGIMSVVMDGSQSDGFYSFLFLEGQGYDPTLQYLIRVNGGPTLAPTEQIQVAEISPSEVQEIAAAAASAVFEEPTSSHNTAGTFGHTVNETRLNTDSLVISVADIETLLAVVRKYDTNRTRIDTTSKQLFVYDDDCTTVLRVFQLYDSLGNPSIDQVTERVPIAATDDQPTC